MILRVPLILITDVDYWFLKEQFFVGVILKVYLSYLRAWII